MPSHDLTDAVLFAESQRKRWPRLLAAYELGLRPQRLIIASLMVVTFGLILSLPELWLGARHNPVSLASDLASHAASRIASGVRTADPTTLRAGIQELTLDLPVQLLSTHPVAAPLLFAVLAAVFALGGVAICRTAALDFNRRGDSTLSQALIFGFDRARASWAALCIPPLIAVLLWLALAAAGWIVGLASWLAPLASVLFGLAILFSIVIVLTAVIYTLGLHLINPAAACDGADSLEALQRAAAYVIIRPTRLLGWGATLLILLLAAAIVAFTFADLASHTAIRAVSTWADPALGSSLSAIAEPSAGVDTPNHFGLFTDWALGFWLWTPRIIAAAVCLSIYFSGSTILYLLLRQAHDGQHSSELWIPRAMIADLDEETETDDDNDA